MRALKGLPFRLPCTVSLPSLFLHTLALEGLFSLGDACVVGSGAAGCLVDGEGHADGRGF
jgi:hypothetical protein